VRKKPGATRAGASTALHDIGGTRRGAASLILLSGSAKKTAAADNSMHRGLKLCVIL